ncbi:CRISPR-associated endonuclease Cas1 [Pseudomonas wenzhouensis]|nr:CRISPR-associated endonuclease Cas1 [Pseudomonas wenzhouensis]MDM9652057.1 CRISPR-associated endonuclease Cas1 [Pseudomonas wenzhouensis]
MTTLIIDHRNVSLDYEGECLLIRQPQQAPRSLPLSRLQRILVMHNTQISTRLIGHCQRYGIDFIVINSRHTEHGFAVHANHLQQAQRRQRQYQLSCDNRLSLPLAKRLIRHKLSISASVVRQHPTPEPAAPIAFTFYIHQIKNCESLASLRGHEGSAQRALFQHWRTCLPAELGFTSRQRRPPPDPVNALLSLSYTLMYHEAIRQCLIHGLDPWLGLYHQLAPGRQSLACDLMEPLRPHIEAWVVSLFVESELDLRHFTRQSHGCHLGKQGREHYYAHWHQQLPAWSKKMGRYARLLARHLDQQANP